MWQDQALPRLRAHGLGLDRAAVTLRLTGIGESAVVDLVGADVLASRNPQLATYARSDSVDLRISATGDGARSAEALVDEAVASLSPRLDTYVFARDEDDWAVALAGRVGTRRVATVEVGTGGYLALLLGSSPFLAHAAVLGTAPRAPGTLDPVALARRARADSGAEIGLAVVARESGDDMRAEVGLDIEGHESSASHVIFRGGEIGRRRSANAGVAELWRRLRRGRPGLTGLRSRGGRRRGAWRTRASGDGQYREAGCRTDRHASCHLASHVAHDLRSWPRLPLSHGRHARITTVTHLDVQRDAAEEVQLVAGREALATTLAEDLRGLAAVRADEGAHVLHQAQDGHGEAPEHREGLLHV